MQIVNFDPESSTRKAPRGRKGQSLLPKSLKEQEAYIRVQWRDKDEPLQFETEAQDVCLEEKMVKRFRQRSRTRSLSKEAREDAFFETHIMPLLMARVVEETM